MIITKIEAQKNPKRVNIYIDNNFAFGLDDEIRYKYGLKSNMEIDDDFIKNVLQDEEESKAFSNVLNYLSYRQRSEKEVIDYLKKQDYDEDLILKVVNKCKGYKYIDDLSFAENFTKDKLNLKKFGKRRIGYELKLKGISQDIINKVLDFDNDLEYEMALALGQKRLSSYKNDDKNKKYRKLSAYLGRRGYDFSVISKVLKEVLKDD